MPLWMSWPWLPLTFGGLLVLLAFLLKRSGARRRRGLARTFVLYVLYLGSLAAYGALRWGAPTSLDDHVGMANRVIEILLIVGLVATTLFDLVLPALHMRVADIVSDLSVGAAYIVTAFWLLHQLGLNLSSLIATSAVLTAILGLSLQAPLGNILGGLALQLDESIRVGDWIEMDKVQGQVRAIRWRHTVIETRDWDTLVVPNANLLAQTFKILGKREAEPLQRRMWVFFNVDFRYSPGEVIRVVEEALQGAPIEHVAAEPKPHCLCFDLAKEGADSVAHYAVRYWLTDILHDDPTNSIVRSRVYASLKRVGIPLAVPGAAIFLSADDPDHARRKREREEAARIAALDSVDLFGAMTTEEKARLAPRMRHLPFSRGEVMMRQGATAHWLYILTKGEAHVNVTSADGPMTVATIRAPSFFGEMGLMTGAPRTATVVALTHAECYRIDKDDFHGILANRPEIALAISTILAGRRVELKAAYENLDAEARKTHQDLEQGRILAAIEEFFGLRDAGGRSS